AEGISDAVHTAIAGPDAETPRCRSYSAYGSLGRSSSGWGEPDERSWSREDYHGERYYPSRYEGRDPFEDDSEPEYDSAEQAPQSPERAWALAVAAGLQAAAWGLRRPGQGRVAPAVGIGLVAAMLTLLGGPTAVALAGLVASALGLLSLPEL